MGCPHIFPHVEKPSLTIFKLLSASVFYLWLRLPKSTPAASAANGLVLASFSPLPHQKPLCGMPSPITCQAKTSDEKLGESGSLVFGACASVRACICGAIKALASGNPLGLCWIVTERWTNQNSNNTWFGWKLCFVSHCVLMILGVGRPCFL